MPAKAIHHELIVSAPRIAVEAINHRDLSWRLTALHIANPVITTPALIEARSMIGTRNERYMFDYRMATS